MSYHNAFRQLSLESHNKVLPSIAAGELDRYMSNHFDLNLELAQREAEGVPVACPWDQNFD